MTFLSVSPSSRRPCYRTCVWRCAGRSDVTPRGAPPPLPLADVSGIYGLACSAAGGEPEGMPLCWTPLDPHRSHWGSTATKLWVCSCPGAGLWDRLDGNRSMQWGPGGLQPGPCSPARRRAPHHLCPCSLQTAQRTCCHQSAGRAAGVHSRSPPHPTL